MTHTALVHGGQPVGELEISIPHRPRVVVLEGASDLARFSSFPSEPARRGSPTGDLVEQGVDGELRFVVNRALYDRTRGEVRLDTRVPTDLMARVKGGGGEKPALVYNLSRGGAFLETHRPSMQGATVAVTFPFPGSSLTIQSKVVSANVPGNLQRHNLPKGMGVEFTDPTSEQIAAIDDYVVARSERPDFGAPLTPFTPVTSSDPGVDDTVGLTLSGLHTYRVAQRRCGELSDW